MSSTKENNFEVSENLLRPIKKLCKTGDETIIREVCRYLFLDLSSKNGEIVSLKDINNVLFLGARTKMKILFIMEHLFLRCKIFRDLICADIKLIANSAGFLRADNTNMQLKVETDDQTLIQNKVKELIGLWDHVFGDNYPSLRVLSRYFKETLRMETPSIMVSL